MFDRTVNFYHHLIALPLPPKGLVLGGDDTAFEMDVYTRFMRHLRVVPTSRPDIQILSSIQFVADMMDVEDAQIAKILVDLGLRAPRSAFPEGYLHHADTALKRVLGTFTAANKPLQELAGVWEDGSPSLIV